MEHLDLFAGIGGFALTASWVWKDKYVNVGHSEIDKYCCRVYHTHFPESKCFGDITKVDWSQVKAELITGGFPCQPFSVAGKRRGAKDDRALWPEMFRAIKEIRPRWVIGENVAGIIQMELESVLSDLEVEGYQTETFVIPACAVNAPHRRDRVWIVAHTIGSRARSDDGTTGNQRGRTREGRRKGIRQTHGKIGSGGIGSTDWNAWNPNFRNGNKRSISEMAEREKTESARSNLNAQYPASDSKSDELSLADTKISKREQSRRTRSRRERLANDNRIDTDPNDTAPSRQRKNGGRILSITESERFDGSGWKESWYEVATRLCRMDDGVSLELDFIGGLLNDQSGDTKGKSKRSRIVWKVLRTMWSNQELAETSPNLYVKRIRDCLPAVPYEDTHGRWFLGKRIKKDQGLCDLWKAFYSRPFKEAQDLQCELLERIRKEKCPKEMGSHVNRLRALGNAIVPQVAHEIFQAIKECQCPQR